MTDKYKTIRSDESHRSLWHGASFVTMTSVLPGVLIFLNVVHIFLLLHARASLLAEELGVSV